MTYIIEYIVKFQNNYVSSFLFKNNFFTLIDKGIAVSPLLNSNIFCYQFDYDEWPSTHFDQETYLRPFNGSIFGLRGAYNQVFYEERFHTSEEQLDQMDSKKIFGVTYKINMLPSLGEYLVQNEGGKQVINEGLCLMQNCADSDELDIFESDNFQ